MKDSDRSSVFVDTSAWIALLQENDSHHRDALATARRLKQQRARLVTTNFVVAETHALLLRTGYLPAVTFLRKAEAEEIALITRAEAEDEAIARAIIYQFTDKDYSLTDAISFAVMMRLGIIQAWSYDRHFVQYGWHVLT